MLTGIYRLCVQGFHLLWPAFPDRFAIDDFVTPQCFRNPGLEFRVRNPLIQNPKFQPGLGYVRFRSPLLTESMSLSFPPGTKMFQFPGFASQRL